MAKVKIAPHTEDAVLNFISEIGYPDPREAWSFIVENFGRDYNLALAAKNVEARNEDSLGFIESMLKYYKPEHA